MDLAVVTSVWGNYGQYLPDWADSIIAQTLRPVEVVIVDAGCDDFAPRDQAILALTDAGIPVKLRIIEFTALGAARNAAVAACSTEWAMHLDADDTLLPHAIAEAAPLQDVADVISLGAIRAGKSAVFPDITAEKILARQHGMFSCGLFRTSFWERRPWHTHNNWVDSTFWVGLAHLGARFASTGRVGFVYRQHPTSVSHALTKQERAAAIEQWKRACTRWTLT